MKKLLNILSCMIIVACSTDHSNGSGIIDGGVINGFSPTAYLRGILPFNPNHEVNTTIARPLIPGLPNTMGVRIPSILQLKNGRLFVMFDARDEHSSDAAANIDTASRYSDDNGKTWSVAKLINNFEDFAIKKSGRQMNSSSFIDSSPVQAQNDDIITLTTMFPGGAGIQGGARHPVRNPFIEKNGKRYLVLTTNKYTNYDKLEKSNDYEFMALATGGPILKISDKKFLSGKLEGYSIDKHWNILKNGKPVLIDQQDGSNPTKKIPSNVAFSQANFRNVRISYIAMNRSKDNGKTWGQPIDISYQFRPLTDNQHYIVSPGVGLRITEGPHKNRLVYVLYETPGNSQSPSSTNTPNTGCNAFSIYSDDNGTTWKQGGYTKAAPGSSKASESQIVEAPDGQLLMYSRGQYKIGLAHSVDGGVTWTDQINTGLNNGQKNGTQFGIINLYRTSGANKEWLAVMTHPDDSKKRTHGTLRIGAFKKSGKKVSGTNKDEWIVEWDNTKSSYAHKILLQKSSTPFGYSSVTELTNGNLAVFFEGEAPYRANNYAEVKLDRVQF